VGEFGTIKNQSFLLVINVEATTNKSESGPGIIAIDEDDVAFGALKRETETRLVTCCRVASAVWLEIYDWWGMVMVLPGALCCSFDTFGFPFKCKKKRSGLRMVWQGSCGFYGKQGMHAFLKVR
jgi:hypothetical protein